MLQLSLEAHTLHFAAPALTSRGALRERPLWLVRAWDSAKPDLHGIGEAALMPGLSIDDTPSWHTDCVAFVAQFNRSACLLTTDEDEPLANVAQVLANFEEQLAHLPSLRFGVECALVDLVQGGNGIYFPSDFTRGTRALPTHGLIWMDSAEGILRQVDAKLQAGFRVLKMKVGSLAQEEELALLRAIRLRAPDVALRLDANGAFSQDAARAYLEALVPLQVAYVEEPLAFADFDGLAGLVAQSPIAIGLDETLLRVVPGGNYGGLLDQVGAQHVILKPALLGGFGPTLAWIAAAEQRGVSWWLNSLLESAIGHSAICQFAADLCADRHDDRIHGIGTGSLFADNFPSPVALRGCALWWQGQVRGATDG